MHFKAVHDLIRYTDKIVHELKCFLTLVQNHSKTKPPTLIGTIKYKVLFKSSSVSKVNNICSRVGGNVKFLFTIISVTA